MQPGDFRAQQLRRLVVQHRLYEQIIRGGVRSERAVKPWALLAPSVATPTVAPERLNEVTRLPTFETCQGLLGEGEGGW
jgi:hypothetical protein